MAGGPAASLGSIADALAAATDLESTVRPILELLLEAGGLDTTYLTTWDRAHGLQEWRFVHNVRGAAPNEGGTWPWNEVLCDHCLRHDKHVIADVGAELPDHPSHTFLGVRGFVSMPYTLVGRGTEVAGTLCGSSLEPFHATDQILHLFELCAHLIADRLGREIELGRERLRADAAERRLEERIHALAETRRSIHRPLLDIDRWTGALRAPTDDDERDGVLDGITAACDELRHGIESALDAFSALALGPRGATIDVDVGVVVRSAWQDRTDGLDVDGEAWVRADPVVLDGLVRRLTEPASSALCLTEGNEVVIAVVHPAPLGEPVDADAVSLLTTFVQLLDGQLAHEPVGDGHRIEVRLPAAR